MAAGAQVCSFRHDRSSPPTTGHFASHSSLLMNLNQQQFWQIHSHHSSSAEVAPDMKVGRSLVENRQKFSSSGTRLSLFKNRLFSGPVCSQSLVQNYLRNISFGVANPAKSAFGICCTNAMSCLNLLEMGHSNATENSITKEMNDFNSCESAAASKKPANQSHEQEICGSVHNGFSPQDDECYESEDSGSECSSDSEGCACDFDSDDDDDLVEFSEEVTHEMVSKPIPECATFLSLCSMESGYYESRSDSPSSCNEMSDNESDQDFDHETSDNEDDHEFDHETSDDESDHEFEHENDILWNCFEQQALSPFIVCASQQNSSHSKCNATEPPPSSNSQLTISQTNCTCGLKEEEPLVWNMRCHSHSSPNICVHNSEQCTSDTTSVVTPTNSTCKKKRKHVSFKPDSELAVVHLMISWDFAYRTARKGPWEQYARDRQHFKRRIDSVGSVITPCLVKKLKALRTT